MAKETIDKILQELENVKSILQKVNTNGKFPDIEKDIALSKLRNIYEFISFIHPVPSAPVATEESTASVKPAEDNKKKVETIEKHNKNDEFPEVTPPITENSPAKPVKEEILAEKLKESGEFMNEVLARYANTFDISKKIQSQPIQDISVAIGLNDKFLFIKELFNNNADLYKHTIDTLNKASDFNNAIQYVDSNFKWDFENPSVQKLLELIRRRFPSS